MGYIATFDIGTTAVKGVLVSERQETVFESSAPMQTLFKGELIEQDPNAWYEGFLRISAQFLKQVPAEEILGIVMSGQMQDVIALDANGVPVCDAILYSDGRAGEQAKKIAATLGMQEILRTVGNAIDGSIPFAKMLWMHQHARQSYDKTHKFVFSSKDAVIARLTGQFCSDMTCCATVGLMHLRKKIWMCDWFERFGLDSSKLPTLKYADERAGHITAAAAKESGYREGTPVYAGIGDAGATTMASGILKAGEFNINLGTSGWVACISGGAIAREGVFNLAAMQRDLYINVVPFLNAGSVHKWIAKTLTPDADEGNKYKYADALLEQSRAGSGGVLFLPYLTGERFPVLDSRIKGAYFGITPETTKQELMRAALEGVVFSIRQGLERFQDEPVRISLIGGGAQTPAWCRIFADVLGKTIMVYQNAEYMPALAISSAVLVEQGKIESYERFIELLQEHISVQEYQPDTSVKPVYDAAYERYLRLYPAIKDMPI